MRLNMRFQFIKLKNRILNENFRFLQSSSRFKAKLISKDFRPISECGDKCFHYNNIFISKKVKQVNHNSGWKGLI